MAMADGHQPIPATPVNVRLNPTSKPLYRTLQRVTYETKGAAKWVYWYWAPESGGDVMVDCGFSGRQLDGFMDGMEG